MSTVRRPAEKRPPTRTASATKARRVAGAKRTASDMVTRLCLLPDWHLHQLARLICAELDRRAELPARSTPMVVDACDTASSPQRVRGATATD